MPINFFRWILFFFILGPGLATFARDLYVSSHGESRGSSQASFRTIQEAANEAKPGDNIRVLAGNYPERVLVTKSGTAEKPIHYVAMGPAKVYGFLIQAGYNRIIGFEISHEKDLGYEGIGIVKADHIHILNCFIHNTSGIAIDPVGASFLVIRGNRIRYPGSPGNDGGPGAKIIDDYGAPGHNVLIEYNYFSHATDYVCSNGDNYIVRNNVMGPTLVSDFGGSPHVDGWQANSQTRYGFMEANWHVDNENMDSHMILIEAPVQGENSHFAVIKNVSLRSGDHLWFQMRDGDHLHAAHNSVADIGFGARKGPGSGGFFYVWEQNTPSLKNYSHNNIFYNVTRGEVYTVKKGNELTHSHDHVDFGRDIKMGPETGNIVSDPRFISWNNFNADDLTLKKDAPDIGQATPLTTVLSGGSGQNVPVLNPDWFYDGFGMTQGQQIYVGKHNNLQVLNVDYQKGEIRVHRNIDWKKGEGVGYAFKGSGPDLGAYELGDSLLTGARISKTLLGYRVDTEGEARFVIFYHFGIPLKTVFSAPFEIETRHFEGIQAQAFALHAQPHPVHQAKQ